MNTPARSLRDRNKQRIRERIIKSAISLVAEYGLDGVTAEAIATDAEVGRATFFRYFDSKESAVIVGFYEQRLQALMDALGAAPTKLGAIDAVIWAFHKMGESNDYQMKLVRLHVRMVTSSPQLRARAMEFHSGYEQAIASAVASRLGHLEPGDLRPRLLAAAILAVVQVSIEHWAASKNAPPIEKLVHAGLEQLKKGFSSPAEARPLKMSGTS